MPAPGAPFPESPFAAAGVTPREQADGQHHVLNIELGETLWPEQIEQAVTHVLDSFYGPARAQVKWSRDLTPSERERLDARMAGETTARIVAARERPEPRNYPTLCKCGIFISDVHEAFTCGYCKLDDLCVLCFGNHHACGRFFKDDEDETLEALAFERKAIDRRRAEIGSSDIGDTIDRLRRDVAQAVEDAARRRLERFRAPPLTVADLERLGQQEYAVVYIPPPPPSSLPARMSEAAIDDRARELAMGLRTELTGEPEDILRIVVRARALGWRGSVDKFSMPK